MNNPPAYAVQQIDNYENFQAYCRRTHPHRVAIPYWMRRSSGCLCSESSTGSGRRGRSQRSTACAAAGGHCCLARSRLCLGAWILFLARPLGLDSRGMGGPSSSPCSMGRGPLGPPRPRLHLDRRTLALKIRIFAGSIESPSTACPTPPVPYVL